MTALILTMLRARWRQALTVAVLAAFATIAATAGPGYLAVVDRSVVDQEVRAATPAERSVTLSSSVTIDASNPGPDFSQIGTALVDLPGFAPVLSADIDVLGVEHGPQPSRLTYRQDACAHLIVVAGRCPMGVGEVMVGTATAKRLNLVPGAPLTLRYAVVDAKTKAWVPGGRPAVLTLVGTYRPADPGELYWGSHNYFGVTASGAPDEPVFTNQPTMKAIDHQVEFDGIDVLAGDRAFADANLGQLRAALNGVQDRTAALGAGLQSDTSIPDLLDRVDRDRSLAGQVIPVAAVPLVLLAWFVIFLAVGYATHGRRLELGLVALRGLRLPGRWLLAAGEALVPILAGTVAGYPLGRLVVSGLAELRLGDAAPAGGQVLPYAAGAGAGALIAALLAQRRELVTPVAELLRRVSAGTRRWRSVALDVVVVVLAVVAAVQLRVSGDRLTGVGLLVPALVMLAVALLTARAVVPLAARVGARSLRRGRTGAALAALQLGRRPGVHRVFVLLVVAVALLGFAAVGFDVAAQARADRAAIATGAPRVLAVNPVTRLELLRAVRAADPAGRYAMAVADLPAGEPGEPAKLAVDAGRLATVASWRTAFGGPGPARLGAELHPAAPAPIIVRGTRIELDVTVGNVTQLAYLGLTVTLQPLSGAAPQAVPLGILAPGPQTLAGTAIGCTDGCRLVGFVVTRSGVGGFQFPLTLRELRTAEAGVVIPATRFADPARWRATVPASAALSASPAGLQVAFHSVNGARADGSIQPADVPYPLPVAGTATLPAGTQLAGLDGVPTAVRQVARVAGLPGLGAHGVLVDLEYADRMSTDAGGADHPRVWLGPAAPADVLDRLRAQGLTVIGDTLASQVRAGLDAQGPAVALWFHLLTGALAVLLAAGGVLLVSTVDRERSAADLRALRIQGLSRPVAGRAGLFGYLVVVLAAAVVGLLAAAVSWVVAGPALPIFVDRVVVWPVPRWPHPVPVLAAWLAAVVLLGAVAVAAGAGLRGRSTPGR